ncbi:MAG TPA: hypothetical protein VNN79_05930 [Actinomycetota bacterium]|nr:hypothetical protein [Actinomycetota bacterium]
MTGYDEATAWLAENAPEWRLTRADSSLEAGSTYGGPTTRRVDVVLVPAITNWDARPDVILSGTGETFVEAVQAAVGTVAPKAVTT